MEKNQSVFDVLNGWVNDTEGSVVNFLTAFAPWLTPFPVAFMTYQHMIDFVFFPPYVSIVIAIVVEILGFATISTGLSFWFFNKKERAKYKKAPLGLVIGAFSFYLTLILISNVVIDISVAFGTIEQQEWAIIAVRSLLTLQTIPGVMIVAARTGHRDILLQVKKEREEKLSPTSGSTYGTSGSQKKSSRNMGRPSIYKQKVFTYMDEVMEQDGRVAAFLEVKRELGLSESTASRIRSDWLEENGYEI